MNDGGFEALRGRAGCTLALGCAVASDGLLGCEVLASVGRTLDVVVAPCGKAGTQIEPFRWLSIVLGNLRDALAGPRYAVAFRKYADRYPEVGYRFDRRFDLPVMVPQLAVALVRASPCPEGTSQMTAGLNT